MKKSLLALAALAAISGAAQAQSNVTIYGVLDMALQHEKTNGKSVTALDSGIQSGSRLGFKGTEDLGGGLKANFKLEMGVNADTGESSQSSATVKRPFGRQAYVGLSGDFGSVNFGRQYSPLFVAVDSADPFGTGITGATAGVGTSGYGLQGFFNSTGPRTDNTVNYTTNNLSGFTGSFAYSFGEAAGDTSASRQVGLSATYAAGPVLATFGYHNANDSGSNGTKVTFFGGAYDFNVVKVAAAYGKNTTDTNKIDNKTWMLGVTVPVSTAGAVIGTYTSQTDNTASTDNTGRQFAIGYTHSLSKRTNLYTSLSRVRNDKNANAGGLAAVKGANEGLANVGIRHMF